MCQLTDVPCATEHAVGVNKKRWIMWAQRSPSPSCRDGSCNQTSCLSHSRCGSLAVNSSAEIIKHASNSLVDERPPSIGQQKSATEQR